MHFSYFIFEFQHLEEAVGPLSKEVEKYRIDYENMKNKFYEEYEERSELKRKYLQGVETLDKLNSKIERQVLGLKGYICHFIIFTFPSLLNSTIIYARIEKENISDKLKDLEEKQALEHSRLQSYNNRKQELSAEINKTADVVRDQDTLRRNIDDNLKFREVKAKVDGCTHEIESLEEKILAMGGISATEADLGKFIKERERLLSEVCGTLGHVVWYGMGNG